METVPLHDFTDNADEMQKNRSLWEQILESGTCRFFLSCLVKLQTEVKVSIGINDHFGISGKL